VQIARSSRTEQAAALEESSAFLAELSAMAAKGAENSKVAAKNIAKANCKTIQATQSLEQMVTSMKHEVGEIEVSSEASMYELRSLGKIDLSHRTWRGGLVSAATTLLSALRNAWRAIPE
jgi:uncharacterized protein with PhoU and TrkA domain